jgi:hypothetical protein
MKRQPTDWEKIFVSCSLGKGFQNIQRAKKIKHKTTNNPINKWANELFSEELQMANNKYVKKCSTSLSISYANQNDTEIPSHLSQNGYHQENKQQ